LERLTMDAERVSLKFSATREQDLKLVAELYRHAKVISHETDGDRVSIDADVPRRLLTRFRRARVRVPA
jgi:hypothetical protein